MYASKAFVEQELGSGSREYIERNFGQGAADSAESNLKKRNKRWGKTLVKRLARRR